MKRQPACYVEGQCSQPCGLACDCYISAELNVAYDDAGQDVAVEVLSSGFLDADGPEDRPSYVEVKVPEKQPAGLLHVEIARGSLLSRSKVPSIHP